MIPQNKSPPNKPKPSFSLKKQNSDSQNIEQIKQSHPKQYRLLTYCFYNNIHQYYSKKHKDILGQLQQYSKIPLAKQQQIFISQNLHSILDKNILKLTKEILNRNTNIAKNINHYSQFYNKINKSSSTQTTHLFDLDQMLTTEKNKDKKYSYNYKQFIKKRPYSSSKNQQKRSVDTMTASPHKNNRNGAISMGKQHPTNNETNNQDPQCYIYIRQNHKRTSKTKLNSKYLKCKEKINPFEQINQSGFESDTYFIKNKSQIMEILNQNQKSIEQINNQKGQKFKILNPQQQSSFAFDLKSIKTKATFNKFFNLPITNPTKQHSTDQIEKIKVQNKILSINTNFFTGITKSQGYRPKSKCWATSHSTAKSNIDFRSTVRQGQIRQKNNHQKQTRFLSTFLRYKP